ncbi:MAG: hypothetical protein IKL04_02845 [Lachnospiraceae bacterium]|nr:hypothetical protein [Lachnospiraceae bacterium]
MAWGSIELTTISRSQDLTMLKQNADNKGMIDQSNLGQQMQKEVEQRTKEVRSGDNTQWHSEKFDAKEKGKNEYAGDGGRRRRKQNEDKVVVKGRSSFDMKV